MTEIGRKTVEGIAEGSVSMETGEKSQTGNLLAEHIRLVSDVVVAEGSSQTGQNHVLSPEFLAQPTGFVQILFNVVAVGTQHHEFASL